MDFCREWVREHHAALGWGPLSRLEQVRNELASRRQAGTLDQEFFERSLSHFRYLSDAEPLPVETVGVVAVPRSAHLLRCVVDGTPFEALIPPTYVDYDTTARRIMAALNALAPSAEPHFVPLHAPLKALAVNLGLAWYGRNNLAYVEGLGSYHQLIGFATDLPLGEGRLFSQGSEPAPHRCQDCTACQKACPTEAIGPDRFLLRAERCLTFFNEYENPWPDWLPRGAHNCLCGCLLCQQACPHNAGHLRVEQTGEELTEEETQSLLAGSGSLAGSVWKTVSAKLKRLGLDDYETVLGRNLRALVVAGRPPQEIPQAGGTS